MVVQVVEVTQADMAADRCVGSLVCGGLQAASRLALALID
jgi:hypothetical protein